MILKSFNDALKGCGRKCSCLSLRRNLRISRPWRWRQQGPLKRWYPTAILHGVTTQKTSTWIVWRHCPEFPGETNENSRKPQPKYLVSSPRFKHGTSRKRSGYVVRSTVTYGCRTLSSPSWAVSLLQQLVTDAASAVEHWRCLRTNAKENNIWT